MNDHEQHNRPVKLQLPPPPQKRQNLKLRTAQTSVFNISKSYYGMQYMSVMYL